MAGEKKVALVVGATGINGNSITKRLLTAKAEWSQVHGTGRRPRPEWQPHELNYIQVDLLNKEDTFVKLSPLRSEVTHLFWVTWVPMDNELANCEANGNMLRHTLEALGNGKPDVKLEHVCLTTGAKHYVGPFELVGTCETADAPYREDVPRLKVPNFYYVQEDILFAAAAESGGHLTYSVHRPSVIFGFAPRGYMNILTAIAVYGTLCKADPTLEFAFPGTRDGWERLVEASDADLIAEHEIWAATSPAAKNQALNINNGDVFKWKRMWNLLGAEIGVSVPAYGGRAFSTAELLRGKSDVWNKIVEEHKLVSTKLEDVGQFWFLDTMLSLGPFDTVCSMNKSKSLGFLSFRDSEESAIHWIRELRNKKIIP